MATTVYTDQIFDPTNLHVTANAYFTLSSTSNEVVITSAGALSGSPVIGIAYNAVDWTAGTTTSASGAISALAVSKTILLKPYTSAVASGDAPTTLTISVSASTGLALGVIMADQRVVNLTILGGTTTYGIDASARTFDVSTKNDRRMHSLGYF